MYRYIIALLVLFSVTAASAQELNCTVKINFDRITDANPQIFRTLEKSLSDFVNNTKFTTRNFSRNERIECSMIFNVSAYNDNNFTSTLTVLSSRPVYNSGYSSPILNYNDKDVNFRYLEGENLIYNPSTFDSNLVSVVAFYANMIIGYDADTFKNQGGTDYYQAAQGIASVAQGNGKGWSPQDGNQSRYFLVNDILSNTFAPLRNALYEYHITALDKMADDQKTAKTKIIAAIKTLAEVHKVRPNAYVTRVFFDAKSDEIAGIFSGGAIMQVQDVVDVLNRISPLNASKWNNIK